MPHRIAALALEIMNRHTDRDKVALTDLLGELVVAAFLAGRSKTVGRRKESSLEERSAAVEAYREGATLNALAQRYKRPKATVHRWVTKAGARRG